MGYLAGPATGDFRIGVIDVDFKYDHPDLYLNTWINQGEIPDSLFQGGDPLEDIDADGIYTFIDLNHPANQGKVTERTGDDEDGNNYIDAGDLLQPVSAGGWANGDDDDDNEYYDDLIGWDFADDDRDPKAGNGHGTHVAGTIAARANNQAGVAGVMWRAQLVPLRYGAACGTSSNTIDAIDYCVDTIVGDTNPTNDIRVINASWGTPYHCPNLYAAVQRARSAGILIIASAGNFGHNIDLDDDENRHHYPASYSWAHDYIDTVPDPDVVYPLQGQDNVISVGASDNDDQRGLTSVATSNYGPNSVHLAAPGTNIWSADLSTSGYRYRSGTSMAAPHVAGVAGLLWSRTPSLSYLEVKSHILNSVRRVAAWDGLTVTGGILDAYEALLCEECSSCPDCNANGVYDRCEIGAGTSCDANKDGMPDECGPCCVPDGQGLACVNLAASACAQQGGTFRVGASCDECSDCSSCDERNPALIAGGYCETGKAPCSSSMDCNCSECLDWKANRFIGFRLTESIPGAQTAIRVRLTSLHHPSGPPNAPNFSALEGHYRYVNAIRDAANVAVFDCPDSPARGTTFKCAKLGLIPEYRDWASAFAGRAVQVTGDAVVPSSQYDVSQIPSSCTGNESSCTYASAELSVYTERWGNADNAPEGGTPSAIDISKVVDKVKDVPGAFSEPLCMLREASPNPYTNAVNAQDIGRVVDSVKGQPYPFGIVAQLQVLCGATSCLEEGFPDVTLCEPGQTCVDGYCRDECGWCAAQ